ncbi:DUF2135 domain-containing protein [Corallococcus sp. AB049A]|jgi:uncharacterized protein YfaP (DUF2135 family)|uniref:DUF2135 domain-containing protein n=1 Tax=Corallococcus interemptor TaxID=2316720 RepID=A0A3A8QK82_9BACT|nr:MULTISPECIES: DUF2135 domain-containing protein [Corallococcus]RKH52421.1 DUF2135 domain-containing protein [Corallococcus sp. AB050B]RKH68171.1 DUF2135 domain-containing protein [Corallococcus interemptor]RKI42840.1 DUF2135 domain-containing protein [Corallococcus sp. AB049A]
MLSVLLAGLLTQTAPQVSARQQGVPIGRGTTVPKVVLSAPSGGWTVDRMLQIEGTVSDATVDPVVVSINGDRYLMRTQGGRFSRKFPAASGKNVVTVMATNKGGTARAQATSYAQVPPVPLKAILTSDTDGVYTDLHIYEPTDASSAGDTLDVTSMAHVYWANTESPSGGTFFLNEQGGDFDQPAYGPYLYIHRAPPQGVYLVATNYWPSGDKAHTVATLNLALFEGTPGEVRRRVRIPLATPGTTRVLAWVNILGDGKAEVYVPSADPKPKGEGWPTNLEEAVKELQKNGDGGGDEGY